MEIKVLLVSVLFGLVSHAEVKKEINPCISANAKTCGECIQIGPQCVWCKDPDFKPSRCDDAESMIKAGCSADGVEYPRGTVTVDKNKPVTNREGGQNLRPDGITQIQPQKLTLNLRSGEPQTFTLTFKRAEDYPIDLYFLMDLSDSMKSNLENVKNLGTELARAMQHITKDLRIGFGSFHEEPFVQTTQLKNLCFPNNCTAPFKYKNVQKLTDDLTLFTQEVSKQKTSGNLDSAEAGFEAMMQAALCTVGAQEHSRELSPTNGCIHIFKDAIGWRDVTRLLVLSTNAGFNFAADVEQGIVRPNDGKCRLDDNIYTMSHYLDYPSTSQLVDTLSGKNIQTIFAVSEKFQDLYQKLSALIPKSVVRTLTASADNLAQLITDTYTSLSSEVILENSRLPDGVTISYVSHCKKGKGDNGRKCPNISIGDEVMFDIEITAKGCPSNGTSQTVKIKPLGFSEEVEVVLNFICECECHKDRIQNSPKCTGGQGTLECGVCRCNEGHSGKLCECIHYGYTPLDLEANCRKDAEADICSNNGDCVCGACDCKKRQNPEERYSGRYCECNNFSCDRFNNRICGGHGRCVCGQCLCEFGYAGSACDCPVDTSTCLASNGQICNGQGICKCGVCRCTESCMGVTCEVCSTRKRFQP